MRRRNAIQRPPLSTRWPDSVRKWTLSSMTVRPPRRIFSSQYLVAYDLIPCGARPRDASSRETSRGANARLRATWRAFAFSCLLYIIEGSIGLHHVNIHSDARGLCWGIGHPSRNWEVTDAGINSTDRRFRCAHLPQARRAADNS